MCRTARIVVPGVAQCGTGRQIAFYTRRDCHAYLGLRLVDMALWADAGGVEF